MSFWRGVIENNIDTDKLGKVQVRIFGKHTENRTDSSKESYLPVSDLPWASPAFSIASPNISGQCVFAIPENGSIVYGFYEDDLEQYPVYFATVPKIVTERPDFSNGFTDPDSKNPKADLDNESQISRLARNEKISETIIQTKKDNVSTGVNCGNGVTFDEPATEYNAEYPNNKVIESKSGHIIELDDTDGVERIHIYHKSGSSIEFFPIGDRVDKTEGNIFKITSGDNNISIDGNNNIHVDINESKKISGNKSLEVGGDNTETITGSKTTNVTLNNTKNITGNDDETITGSKTTNVTLNNTKTVLGNDVETITGSKNVTAPTVTISGGTTTITGGTLIVNGTPNISAGPFCALPNCLFTGAPHQGNIVSGT